MPAVNKPLKILLVEDEPLAIFVHHNTEPMSPFTRVSKSITGIDNER